MTKCPAQRSLRLSLSIRRAIEMGFSSELNRLIYLEFLLNRSVSVVTPVIDLTGYPETQSLGGASAAVAIGRRAPYRTLPKGVPASDQLDFG